ncbi:TetR/AcrR family transcriptional regulator [Winogradskya consettensis]|uniref:TetR/AcrR family transcriptional regulator n=1 Tax=Winogradskya consettensis TaxID=113560 RepID=UPI001BB439B9|nr:TetR family transcriptional regulator [Actinoplanes consettensis]
MPKRVDHEVRRREIAEAVWRIAATRGLPAATLREVAGEAGVSMRLVQYYFETKEQLVVAAFQQLTAAFGERMRERFAELGRAPGPRDVMGICLAAVLPTDERSLMMSRVQSAYFAASLTDPAIAAAAGAAGTPPPTALENLLAAQIELAVAAGDVPAGVDATLEARGLAALGAGLASMVVAGLRSPAEAAETVEYRLGELFRSR